MFILETNHTYQFAGTYNYTMTVKTNRGEEVSYSGSATVSGEVPNQAPVASVYCYSNDLNVTCDASSSYDPDGVITQYQWDMGDGNVTNSGNFLNHNYALAGSYTIQLTIFDNLGKSSQQSVLVNPVFMGQPPTIDLNCASPEPLVASCIASATSIDGENVNVVMTLEDGTTFQRSDLFHQYAIGGTKTIAATVTDRFGRSASQEVAINVGTEVPRPVAFFGCDRGAGLKVICDATTSATSYGRITSYKWRVNDEIIGTEVQVEFDLPANQDQVIKLEVSNSYNQTSHYEQTVNFGEGEVSNASSGFISFNQENRYYSTTETLVFNISGAVLPAGELLTEQALSEIQIKVNENSIDLSDVDFHSDRIEISNFLVEGRNEVSLHLIDIEGKVLNNEYLLFAGSRTIHVSVANSLSNSSLTAEFLYIDENAPKVSLVSEIGSFLINNFPIGEGHVLVSSLTQVGSSSIKTSDINVEVNLITLSELSTTNNDFQDGLNGWLITKGNGVVQENPPRLFQQEGKGLALNFNLEGESEFFKSILVEVGKTQASLDLAYPNQLRQGHSIVSMRSRSTGEIKTELVLFGNGIENDLNIIGSMYKQFTFSAEPGTVVDVFVYSKLVNALEEEFSLLNNILKFNSVIANEEETAMRLLGLHAINNVIVGADLRDRRNVKLGAISLGYYHPYPNFSEPDFEGNINVNQSYVRRGINNLYLPVVMTTDTQWFSEMNLILYNSETNAKIAEIPIEESFKIERDTSRNFRIPNTISSNLYPRVAFKIRSNQIQAGLTRVVLAVLKVRLKNSINYEYKLLQDMAVLSSLEATYIRAGQVYPRYTSTLNNPIGQDWNKGGDDFVSTAAADIVRNLLGRSYQINNNDGTTNSISFNLKIGDISVLNGGRFPVLNPNQRLTSHQYGMHIDLNFETHNASSLFSANAPRTNHQEVDLLLQLLNFGGRNVLIHYTRIAPNKEGEINFDAALASPFSAKVYSTCFGNEKAEKLIIPEKNHYNHAHLQLNISTTSLLNTVTVKQRSAGRTHGGEGIYLSYTNTIGEYAINGLSSNFNYRWLFEGDPSILPGTVLGVLYPIELLSDYVTIDNSVIKMEKKGVRQGIKLSVMPINKKEDYCTNIQQVIIREHLGFEDSPFRELPWAQWGETRDVASYVMFKPECEGLRDYGYNFGPNNQWSKFVEYEDVVGSGNSQFNLFVGGISTLVGNKRVLLSGNIVGGTARVDPECAAPHYAWVYRGNTCEEMSIKVHVPPAHCGNLLNVTERLRTRDLSDE
jgi:PKD repeat protein